MKIKLQRNANPSVNLVTGKGLNLIRPKKPLENQRYELVGEARADELLAKASELTVQFLEPRVAGIPIRTGHIELRHVARI